MTTISYKNVLDKAIEAFEHDKDKALAWYMNKDKNLDNLSPFDLCRMGRGKQIIQLLNRMISSCP